MEWIGVYGRLHPILVHLPIGMLAALFILELVSRVEGLAIPRKILSALVWLTAASAALAASSGWTLSHESGYGGETLTLHMRVGIGIAATCLTMAILHLWAGDGTRGAAMRAYRLLLLVAVIGLVPAGYLGSTIAHGEGFLTASLREGDGESVVRPAEGIGGPAALPASAEGGAPTSGATGATPPVARAGHAISYTRDIAPILASRCTSCHGGSKKKGGLSLQDPASILEGSWSGPVIARGDAQSSEVVRRLHLPIAEEDHMPPEGKPQPTEEEITLLEAWIAAGAVFDVPGVSDPAPGDAALGDGSVPRTVVGDAEVPPGGNGAVARAADAAGIAPAPEEALAALRAALVHVEPVAKGSNLLSIDFAAAAGSTGDTEVALLLEPVLLQTADLSLSRCKISDESLRTAARMPNLSRLELRETAVTDAGIAALAGHARLSVLVLPRTRLTDASVDHLLALPALRKVFLWNSGVTIQGIARLRGRRADLGIEAGTSGDSRPLEREKDVVLTKPAPPADSTGTSTSAPAAVNTACPVTGKPVDPAYQVVFRGRVVGFCCPKCPSQFLSEPEKYQAKLR